MKCVLNFVTDAAATDITIRMGARKAMRADACKVTAMTAGAAGRCAPRVRHGRKVAAAAPR